MQPEPTEPSPYTPTFHASESTSISQYGIHHLPEPRAVLGDSRDVHASYSSSGVVVEDAGVQEQLRRLSVSAQDEKRPKASFQQISEYENALSPSTARKENEGPVFKIVKKKGNKADSILLENFPNEVLTHILSHLPANSLSAVSLVSRTFYNLVTTPHAWRTAFARFFPGQDALVALPVTNRRGSDLETREQLRSETRLFTRLTALASWRSEYILRTRLLRSLGRGKPAQIAPGHGNSSRSNSAANNANAVVTYSSQLFATVSHIHAVFGSGKKSPRFVHGTDETGTACTSDPNIGRIDNWGISDPQALPQFSELFVGDQPYGDGDGPAGLPNSMDVSQPFGMVYGEGFPGGQAYFRSSDEMRGRFLGQLGEMAIPDAGIPGVPGLTEGISAVWIAKSTSVPLMTDGLIGILTGSTLGVVTAYSLGADTPSGRRIPRGKITAKWVLSPGVPIIAIKVDESYNSKRKASGRIWAVALNALGEVFYITETPISGLTDGKVADSDPRRHAWVTGRTAYWNLAEPSRRVAREDPYREAEIHGSYSPRSSSKNQRLSKAQIVAETNEIEKFLAYRPVHFRKLCEGWDMRRILEVDFAGDDGHGAGEGIFVIKRGLVEGEEAEVRRLTRWKSEQASLDEYPLPKTPPMASRTATMASLFGGGTVISSPRASSPERSQRASIFGGGSIINPARMSSPEQNTKGGPAKASSSDMVEEWRCSDLSLREHPNIEITTSGIDMSTFALLTVEEDPLCTVDGTSNLSSPFATPSDAGTPSSTIPGHRARFLAVGTKNGSVIMWNMRGPQSTNPGLTNELHPLRTIYTDSPQISCLAVSALYLIHGGNDGLVQTWDPLASSLQPLRTLNSRFSSRARRRLVQAEASALGVGINLYAAGAIAIDPDPTVLRGMVSLGTHLRYWSYSSSAADQYQSKKRRLRRSNERGSNSASDRFTNTGRGALMDYITTEQDELKEEKLRRSREEARLQARFGVGLGGLSEDEALKYAEMVSAEAFQKEEEERRYNESRYLDDFDESSTSQSFARSSSETVTPEGSIVGRAGLSSPPKYQPKTDDEFENDLEEAIRLSLLDSVDEGGRSPRESGAGGYEVPITYKQLKKSRRSASSSPSTSQKARSRKKGSGQEIEVDDLDFALQLSLAEERSRLESAAVKGGQADLFPALEQVEVKAKGKGRAV
ncbi:hypothetical protein LZ554_003429 [Drepanopeziza brunnea f. sp. 'monogermtubi']|nr:hypothetical protein LZ554_003429 [Drepanopeziza brunnea f. sp. 'monogermtubi']